MKATKFDLAPIFGLGLLVLIIFREYFTGAKSPSWDFLNDYFTASFVWWNSGSFFNPPSYLPYAFSGFPAHLSGQAANWYLPVGFLAELNIYNIHTSAILQALTIFFGIVGIYFFARSWDIARYVAFLLAVAYLFSPGFFTSASHIDILRGWAFMPWILLVLKPFARNSIFSILAISLLSFQYMVGVYPGIIIASIYILAIYVSLNWYFNKSIRKNYTLYQIIPFALGIGMSLLKWIPLVTQERLYRGGNTVEVNAAIVSTLIYPYDSSVLPNDITMRSLFLAPVVMFCILLIQKINRSVAIFMTLGLVSIILGFDLSSTTRWQEYLPFLGESRFRTTDFKLFWTLSALMLAGFALDQAKQKGISVLRGALALAVGFFIVSYLNRLAKTALLEDMLTPGNTFARIAGGTFALIIFFLVLKKYVGAGFTAAISIAIIGTVAIGIYWSEINKTPWSFERIPEERFYYEMEVDQRILEGKNREINIRPERIGPKFPIPYPAELTSHIWSNSEVDRSFSLGGYVPLKGIPRYESMIEFALKEESVSYYALLAESQTGWIVSKDKSDLETVNCIYDQTCLIDGSTVLPIGWDLDKLEYSVSTMRDGLLTVNEIPWEGWQAEVCSDNACEKVKTKADLGTLLLSVPVSSDTKSVTFFYQQPFKKTSWIIFWFSLIGVLMLSLRIKKKVV